jgi:hypothetical protein
MMTTSPDPAQPAEADQPISKSGKINWRAILDAHPHLIPPGYDETLKRMGYEVPELRRQPVGYPELPYSVQSLAASVDENQTLRQKRDDARGGIDLPYADARKKPEKWDRNLNGR